MAIPPIPSRLTLEMVTPDRVLAEVEVDEVHLPAENGYIGILPGHTPLLASLRVGEMWYRTGPEKHFLAVSFGFVEVLPDRLIVLARTAERAEEIDMARAEAAKHRAEARLERPTAEVDLERARVALMKALIRLQVSSKARTRA